MSAKDQRPEPGIVSTAFIHDDFVRKSFSISGLFEKRRFLPVQHSALKA
jgi:hypothetical protein